jgi:hypothetical protein
MTFPDKPIEVDLDAIGIDGWIAFADASAQLQQLRGARDVAAIGQALRGAREVLIVFLAPAWSEEEIGALNLGEMKAVMTRIGQGTHGPNSESGSPSTQPMATAGRSPSAPVSVGLRRNGRAPRGRLRPRSA